MQMQKKMFRVSKGVHLIWANYIATYLRQLVTLNGGELDQEIPQEMTERFRFWNHSNSPRIMQFTGDH